MPQRSMTGGYRTKLKRVFSGNRTLRSTLGAKARKEALSTLGKFKKSGGRITQNELRKSYRKWAGDKKDNITRTQAKIIKRELNEYADKSEQAKKEDTRDYLNKVRSGKSSTSRSGSIATSNDTRAYFNKMEDRLSSFAEPKTNASFARGNNDLPNSFADEESDSEREQLF